MKLAQLLRTPLTLVLLATIWARPAAPVLAQSSETASPSQLYWGAHIDGYAYGYTNPPWDMRGVATFEANAGRGASILTLGSYWVIDGKFQPFDTKAFDTIRQHGSIPLFTWSSAESGKGVDQPRFRNRVIADGAYDEYIRSWARAAKAWGHPFFLRLNGEMDGWWHPWGEGRISEDGPIVNGNAPGDFVAMWRHVHQLFVEEGVENVTWVWCIGHLSTSSQYPPLSQIYPGDDVVHWTGLDPYNKYRTWMSFSQTITGEGIPWMKNSYEEMLAVAPDKPMMLGEFGSIERVDDQSAKASWLRDALLWEIPTRFPQIRAVVYFNWALNHPTVTIESSIEAQEAFAEALRSGLYVENSFRELCVSPIPPDPQQAMQRCDQDATDLEP